MIKAVFFDFDGVLSMNSHACPEISQKLSELVDVSVNDLEPAYHDIAVVSRINDTDYSEFARLLSDALKTEITVEHLVESAQNCQKNDAMLNFADELRSMGVQTGIITDNSIDRIESLRSTFNLDNFDPIIISQIYGVLKQQGPKLFEVAIEKIGLAPEEVVFVDDHENKLIFARRLSIKTYHLDNPSDIASFRNFCLG